MYFHILKYYLFFNLRYYSLAFYCGKWVYALGFLCHLEIPLTIVISCFWLISAHCLHCYAFEYIHHWTLWYTMIVFLGVKNFVFCLPSYLPLIFFLATVSICSNTSGLVFLKIGKILGLSILLLTFVLWPSASDFPPPWFWEWSPPFPTLEPAHLHPRLLACLTSLFWWRASLT